jgi:anti-sigma B factor antagonist
MYSTRTNSYSGPDIAMETRFRQVGTNYYLAISGRITIDSSPDLRKMLLQYLAEPGCDSLTVDFFDVAYVDTSGLAVLVEILRAARGLKKSFRVSGLRERPRYLLEATRLLHFFDEVPRDVLQ